MNRPACKPIVATFLLVLLAGCATTDTSKVLTQTQQDLATFTTAPLDIAFTTEQVAQRRAAKKERLRTKSLPSTGSDSVDHHRKVRRLPAFLIILITRI